jgi:hypothetical protein
MTSVLRLTTDGSVLAGSHEALVRTVRQGGDLRIRTEFRVDEHLDPESRDHQLVVEVSDFPVTYVVAERWVAGIMTLRQPVFLPDHFGPPSMSFFLYNQDGGQAIARPSLDRAARRAAPTGFTAGDERFAKLRRFDSWDVDSHAPSSNFRYDFDGYEFFVEHRWSSVYSHDAQGTRLTGSLDELVEAASCGRPLKVGVKDLVQTDSATPPHWVFVELGPNYYYTESRRLVAQTRPLVRVTPAIPLRYETGNWDFGWLIVSTDGDAQYLRYDPATLAVDEVPGRHALEWFVDRA